MLDEVSVAIVCMCRLFVGASDVGLVRVGVRHTVTVVVEAQRRACACKRACVKAYFRVSYSGLA
jgi:hypothetical protein